MYGLLMTSPFRIPTDPGPLAIYYPPRVAIGDAQGNPVLDGQIMPTYQSQPAMGRAEQATINAHFKCAKNYWESYQNIQRAVFNCLDDGVDNAFKVSNDPVLAGWNPLMEPREMFDQITATYGRPTPAALLQNDTLFQSVYPQQDAPEVLFRRIRDCQEVQILGEDPYTAQQLLNNAVRLLLQTGLYTRDFEDWDCKIAAGKIWMTLKTFIQECYTRRSNATSITTGAQGYVQSAFAALAEESDDDDDDVQTVITQMAALMTQSQLTASTAANTNALVTAAINQLAANQQAMQHQFAAFATTRNTTHQPATPTPPPVQQFNIPNLGTFQPAGLGVGGRQGGRGHGKRANAGRQGSTPFANFMGRRGQGGLPPIGGSLGRGVAPFAQQNVPRNAAPMYSNIIKWYANWNICFSCGFDVEDGHTSKTCPAPWKRANHQEGYTR